MKPHPLSVQGLAGGKGRHSAGVGICDQGCAGSHRTGKEGADREVALAPVPAQLTQAAKCTSVQ